MDAIYPFSESDRWEVRQVALILFNGGMPCNEIAGYAKKWALFFKLFYTTIDRKTGSFLHLPFGGGVMEQPAKTMDVLRYLQSLWIEKIADEMERVSKGGQDGYMRRRH